MIWLGVGIWCTQIHGDWLECTFNLSDVLWNRHVSCIIDCNCTNHDGAKYQSLASCVVTARTCTHQLLLFLRLASSDVLSNMHILALQFYEFWLCAQYHCPQLLRCENDLLVLSLCVIVVYVWSYQCPFYFYCSADGAQDGWCRSFKCKLFGLVPSDVSTKIIAVLRCRAWWVSFVNCSILMVVLFMTYRSPVLILVSCWSIAVDLKG